MNVFEVPDLVRVVAQSLTDIRVLRLNRALDEIICAHPEYAIWKKCTRPGDIYRYGIPKMVLGATESDLQLVAASGNLPMLKHFAAGADLKMLLCHACMNGQLPTVKYLVSVGADCRDMLFVAVEFNHPRTAKWLIRHGASSTSTLITACWRGYYAMVRMLVSVGANPTLGLSGAVLYGHIKIVQSVRVGAVAGDYELYCALSQGHFDVAKFLISTGARPGEQTLEFTRSNPELTKLLL